MTLKAERTRRELTQEELAEMAGVDQGTISLIERGKTSHEKASWGVVARLSAVLRKSPHKLFPINEVGK